MSIVLKTTEFRYNGGEEEDFNFQELLSPPAGDLEVKVVRDFPTPQSCKKRITRKKPFLAKKN